MIRILRFLRTRRRSIGRDVGRVVPLVVAMMGELAAQPAAAPPNAAPPEAASRPELVALLDSLRVVRRVPTIDGVPQYAPATVTRWRGAVARLSSRHRAMASATWPVADRVDHAVVGTQLAAFDFELRVLQPWARDPGHWVDLVARSPYAELPADGAARARLRDALTAVPGTMREARRRLTRPAEELARMAVFHLDSSDEVNQGEPRRPRPPAGVIGWYRDLLARARTVDPALVPDIERAVAALEGFRDWLLATAPTMREPAFVGLDHYAWYVR
ncbi:MAG: hypothetical protein MUF53_04335, partial [Gemmatimonadaceae bacterium]|nr:hypothetical protein [Gemmatimonadaceae bacterium]